MQEPVNAAYGETDVPRPTRTPVYVAGYRIPAHKFWIFVLVNVLFVVAIVVLTVFYLPLGIPFLAVKQSNGFLSYVGFFILYVFGYIGFFIITLTTVGISGYAVHQRYFPDVKISLPSFDSEPPLVDPAAPPA